MKICLRYLSPKSPFSERGLAIASLQVFFCLYFYLLFVLSGAYGEVVQKYENMSTLPIP